MNDSSTSSTDIAPSTTGTASSVFDKSYPLDNTYTPKKKPLAPHPKAAPTAAPTGSSNVLDVTVKKGDSLDKIAKANGSTIEAIVSANSLKNSKLNIGDVLHVPVVKKGSSSTIKPATNTPPTANPPQQADTSTNQSYTVKKGDNPWKIAKQHHMRYDQFLKLNNLDEASAKNLQVGDKVQIQPPAQ